MCLQKERDLELAARIGQSLLKKNKTLSDRNELLEEQVEHIREEVRRTRPLLCDSLIKRDGLFSKDPAVRHRLTLLKLLPSLVVILRFNRLFSPSAQVSQLRHDLSMKDELLQFYTNAAEESEGESVTSTP